MIKRLLVVLAALALVFGGIFGWKYYQIQQMAEQAAAPPPPATVTAAPVRVEAWQPQLFAVGTLVANQGVFVSNEVPGQVARIAFESGQQVAQGEVLVQLDAQADRAELEGFIAEQRLAQVQFRRTARLLKDKSVSQADYDEAQANLQNARARVEAQRALIDKKTIQAPFSGILGIRRVDLGQYLAAGTEIVSLQALESLYVDYTLPERHLSALAVGQRVAVQVQAWPQRSFAGRIDAISPRVDPVTRNVEVRALLPNPDRLLRPGMFAQVQTILPDERRVLTVPRNAITYNPYGDSVFVVQQENAVPVAERRQVTTGEVREERVEIRSGLQEDQLVVSAGQVKLRDGQPVAIDNSVRLEQARRP